MVFVRSVEHVTHAPIRLVDIINNICATCVSIEHILDVHVGSMQTKDFLVEGIDENISQVALQVDFSLFKLDRIART